jgi:3-methyladenine DNA glycosylase AlkC
MHQKVLLKDLLFNQAKVERIAGEIQRVYPAFGKRGFVQDCVARFPELELKARIAWIAACLKSYLPGAYPRALGILIEALPAPNNPDLSDDDFGEFIYAPYAEFVAQNGCTRVYLQPSLAALYEITQRFSAEDAIRYFINAFPKETMRELSQWSRDAHYHVRRLCSEGTRPKLPWAKKIAIPVAAPLPILDRLHADNTRFVTRSVANHLNDIAKVDPDLAITTLTRWQKAGKQNADEMNYILRHALRTLIKQGHPEALKLLGFRDAPGVRVTKLLLPRQVPMNSALEFSFTVKADADTRVLIDYSVHFQNKAGKPGGKKVFKLCKLDLEKNKPVVVSKRHMLRQDMTTRTLYPGEHVIEIQVNGRKAGKAAFQLG